MKSIEEILAEPIKRIDGQLVPPFELKESTESFIKQVYDSVEEWKNSSAGIDNNNKE